MDLLETVADQLARKALELPGTADDNTLINQMAEAMGASSSTLQEAFLTAVRIRRAEARAERALEAYRRRQNL